MGQLSAIAALLSSVFMLIAGNSLVNTLVATRAKLENFPQLALGLLGSAYFVGMLAGTLAAPALVRHAGFVRAFAASVAVAVAVSIAYPLWPHPVFWIGLRGALGFAFAVLYGVIEAWVQSRATNETRGGIYGFYQIVHFAGATVGQQLLQIDFITSFTLFSAASILTSLAIIPLALTRAEPPGTPRSVRLRIGWLIGVSPVGAATALAVGCANGALWFLAPIFALGPEQSPQRVAAFMTAIVVGSAVGVLPIGRLSDRFDRRIVIVACAAAGAAVELALWAYVPMPNAALIVLGFMLGTLTLPLYMLAASHANDRGGPDHAVEVSSGLLFLYCLAAIFSPYGASSLMGRFGDSALFAQNAVVHALLVAFTLWRISIRAPASAPVTRDEEPTKPATGFP
jgi:MFS family permease